MFASIARVQRPRPDYPATNDSITDTLLYSRFLARVVGEI
jgi:hypothetical protein